MRCAHSIVKTSTVMEDRPQTEAEFEVVLRLRVIKWSQKWHKGLYLAREKGLCVQN